VLCLTFSIVLLGSAIPYSFSLDTFRTFNRDFLDVSSPALQLQTFVVEIKFRATEQPIDREYLVSKASVPAGNLLLDNNYALFITPFNKITGGFRGVDGTYNYVYSDAIDMTQWHVAKLVYNGTELKLVLDGKKVASKAVTTIADATETGPLRIGANANKEFKFFLGDIDYVKVLNQATFKIAYSVDFDGVSPDPDPDPVPVQTGTCSAMPMKDLRGVVFLDPKLARTEGDDGNSSPTNYVEDSMKYINLHGFNLVRVPYYWEGYQSWPSAFMAELDLVAQAAQKNDICVIFDNHHWYTSSYAKNLDLGKKTNPKGFPTIVMSGYPATGDYESAMGQFWTDFLANNISINGKKIWDVQAEFMAKVINKVDKYDSVTGYEILNEPHLFDVTQYDDLGNYHTYMAKKIRALSDKKIFFDRETTRGFQRQPTLEYKIVPEGVAGVVYGPHLYSVPTPGTQGEIQVDKIAKWSEEWGVEILLGEFAGETQADIDSFITTFKAVDFGWTYYKWAPDANADNLGNILYDSDKTETTIYLTYLTNSMNEVY
jgi:cellulase (glycosyl hydrolase family 5)/concanavalin A-like lectin/glucanase superfamily protein